MSLKRNIEMPPETSREDAFTLLDAADSKSGSRERVRALLARDPEWIDRLGSLAGAAEDAVIAQVGDQVIVQELARAELERMRAALLLPSDGPLEHLLANHVALCWLNLTTAETQRAVRVQKSGATQSTACWDRRVSRLNGDFMRASKTLAMVRRLRRPSVQVNVAQQQVNVAH